MSRDAITEIEQERQKKQIEQTLEESSWDIPRLLKINARLVKEKHAQAEQIADCEVVIDDQQDMLAKLAEQITGLKEQLLQANLDIIRLEKRNED